MDPQPPFKLGDLVKYKVHPSRLPDRFAYGLVVALEHFEDDNGVRHWTYVRWINPDGKPEAEPLKHSAQELTPFPLD